MMEQALEKIKAAREAIWFDEPSEIARLSDIKGAWNQGASTVLYAATKLATLITFLNHARGMAMAGGIDLNTMKAVTRSFLDFHARSYGGFFQLADTAKTVGWAQEALLGISTLDDYAVLVGELAMYLNRVDYWLDLRIPWAEFGRVFEQGLKGG
jgi:hypothetical protein